MEFEYSPRHHHSPSGAAHLLSPTHAHAQDAQFASIRQLRRQLSRSPSKPARFHLFTRGPNTSPIAPVSPSALSRSVNADGAQDSAPRTRFSLKRTGNMRSTRRTSPNSPLRRALSDNTNQIPTAPPRLVRRTSAEQDQENMDCAEDGASKPNESRFVDEPIKLDFSKARENALLQPVLKEHAPPKSSPLKRSDGVMNLEAASVSSPRVKRRSLHGAASFGSDFNVFDQGFDNAMNDSTEFTEDGQRDPNFSSTWPNPSVQSPHRRPFGLRKSTLQQRAGPARSRLFAESSHDAPLSPALTRARSRISLDSALPLRSLDFDSPFRRNTASDPPVFFQPPVQRLHQSAPKPHPLSHALTPSSSTSSMAEEQPCVPQQADATTSTKPVMRKPVPNFSKSLPIGSMRPALKQHDASGESFATPAAYKMAKPLPQAFMSTGLISKRNRNVDMPGGSFFGASQMPDTPSKKTHVIIASSPAPPSGLGKMAQPQHEFGSPTTPFNGRFSKMSPEAFGKGANIFGAQAPQLTRRGSFISINGDDMNNSPTRHLESQASGDELPPTPTKSTAAVTRPQSKGKSNSLRSSLFGRRSSLGPETFAAPAADDKPSPQKAIDSKSLLSLKTPRFRTEKKEGRGLDESPKPVITLTSSGSPTPASRRRHSTLPASTNTPFAKSSAYSGIYAENLSPTVVKTRSVHDGDSPRTPQESFTPPDPSKLSISAEHKGSTLFPSNSFPPATPTGPRDQPALNMSLGMSNISSGYFANDVDTSLTARFGSMSSSGIGEFSQVYRVEKPLTASMSASQNNSGHLHNVWAVKKSRKPYTGNKDRQRKMREVQILKQLRGHEHVIELVDEWESKNHLYIQTEYCENGNLKDFLSSAGFKGRLDDFRIWKILLELSQGVKSIHDSGIIHLDLKPANVFIDWEGVLKIGDFGMASSWPAPAGLDGEGDREYIGPEVLCGRFDKPADIFALGMIMLEIAGNIVLPDNGTSWQRLRAGDMSDLPSLTWSSDSSLMRDESGDPVELLNGASNDSIYMSNSSNEDLDFLLGGSNRAPPKRERSHALVEPPNFMVDPMDPASLDRIVQWMICPDPDYRPVIDQLLTAGGVQWVERRRRAGATVFEGNWGPADEVLGVSEQDVEMLDI